MVGECSDGHVWGEQAVVRTTGDSKAFIEKVLLN